MSRVPFSLFLRRPSRTGGFSLVEVVLAIGVVTFCMTTLIALIPVGLNANRLSREQIIAMNLCRDIESDLKSTPAGSAVSPLYGIAIPATGAANVQAILYDNYASPVKGSNNSNVYPTFGSTPSATSQYRFTIVLTAPSASTPSDPVMGCIAVSWPAASANPPGKEKLNVAINRVGS